MKHPIRTAAIVLFLGLLCLLPAQAQLTQFVDLEAGTWTHGGTSSTGWDSAELAGNFVMTDGNSVTMTVSFAGSATATGGNLSIIDESYFQGFAFQMDPATTTNTGTSLANYERIDLEFDLPVLINEFVIMDVDRASWDDILLIEGWSGNGGVGTMGSGFTSDYAFRDPTNLGTETLFGSSQVVVDLGGNTVSGPESDLLIDFSQPVDAISLYYWNGDYASSASTQTIGVAGNGFTVTTVPEPAALILALPALAALLLRRTRLDR